MFGCFDSHLTACKFCRGGGFHVFGVGQSIAFAGFIEGGTKAHLAGGGDGGMAAGDFCNLRCERIGAVMSAEQGDDGETIFGNGDHWRLVAFVVEMGGNGADENAAGAEADDGLALLEETGEMGGCIGVGDIAAT